MCVCEWERNPKKEKKIWNRLHIRASDALPRGEDVETECDGDDEDGDDGDVHNGGIHIGTRWRFCPSVIRASTPFSHAYISAVRHT